MSFYSALVLAANKGVRDSSPEALGSVIVEAGLERPESEIVPFGNLAYEISELFNDDIAREKNRRFFCPDSINVHEDIEIHGWDEGEWKGKGLSIHIHGNGYLFPWDFEEIRKRVLTHPKLVALKVLVEERFGGEFILPRWRSKFLISRTIEHDGGWAWFASEG